VACVKAVALYGSELWWDPKEAGRRDDLQLRLNRQARSIQGALPTTPQGALMRESGLTPAPVILDSRQQRFAVRLADACSSKLKELHRNPSSRAQICRVVKKQHEHSKTTEGMVWPAPGEQAVLRTTILEDASAAKRTGQHWAREKEAKIGAGLWIWWSDGSHSDDGRVGAIAVFKHGNQWRSRRSFLGTVCMGDFDAELWPIGLALDETIDNGETLQRHGARTVTIFSDSEIAIR